MIIRYLVGEEVLAIHHAVIEKIGGTHGVRDLNLFQSILERPKGTFAGREIYPDIFTKAAVYLEGFACFHVFIDGNKRTGLAAASRFLHLNNIELSPTNKTAENFMLVVATKKPELKKISLWLKINSHVRTQ